jgi:hypothetical protein
MYFIEFVVEWRSQIRRMARDLRIFPAKFPVNRELVPGDSFDPDCVLSQPTRSRPGDFLNFAKSRHFRRLAVRSLVSCEEFRASRTEGLESRGVSLLAEFRP